MTIDEIEARICAAVAKAKADGWTICPNLLYPDEVARKCCALSALDLKNVSHSFSTSARIAFNFVAGSDWPWNFASGFDGNTTPISYAFPEAFELGRKLRKEML